MPRTLFDRACEIDLLYTAMVAQSETPEWDGGGKSDKATLATIKYHYGMSQIGGNAQRERYEDASPSERAQFNRFCKRVLAI